MSGLISSDSKKQSSIIILRHKEATSDHGKKIIETHEFLATCRQNRSKEMKSCIPACAFPVL